MKLRLLQLPEPIPSVCRMPALLLLALISLAGPLTKASALEWTGLSGVTNGWSDLNNWSPAQVPTASDSVTFTNGGSSDTVGLVNNTVGANMTISNLSYTAISNSVAANTHTTQIDPGATLTVNSALNGTNGNVLFVGADNVGASDQIYASVVGEGTLAIGNLASPNTNLDLMVSARALTANSGTHRGTLDLSGLDNFTFGGGRFQVNAIGISAVLYPGNVGVDRALGSALLAKTNVITAARSKTDQFPFAISPFALAVYRFANSSANLSLIELGQENTINADAITLGGARASGGGTMRFRTGLTDPTLKLRGADGTSRVAEIGIGDNDIPNGATVASVGTLDLSLGIADILVENMVVGMGNGFNNLTQAANGTGTLTLGAGICDVTTLNIGCQRFNNICRAIGTVNVRAGATLIAGTVNMGFDAGDAVTAGNGTLNITGGQAWVSGNLGDNSAPGFRGTNTLTINTDGILDMMPPGDTVPGNIKVRTLNIGSGTLTNYGMLSTSFINQTAPVDDFIVYPGQALAPVAPGAIGTLAVKVNLTLDSAILRFDLDAPASLNDQIVVTNILTLSGTNTVEINAVNGTIAPGTYTLMTYGFLAGDTNNLQIGGALANSRYAFEFDTASSFANVNLIVSGSPGSLIWSGDGAGNLWNFNGAANWNSNAEKFFNLDAVTFDDTSANRAVTVAGTLFPGRMVVNSDNNYTLSGSGKISGTTGLEKNGAGTLTVNNVNDFDGALNVNAGALQVNGTIGNAAVAVKTGASLAGTGTILGPVTVESGGTLSPGATIGTLSIGNNLVLAAGSTTVIEANLDTTHDKIIGLNRVTYGGTLSLVLSGRPPVGGDTFKLFSATTAPNPILNYSPYSGAFTDINPAAPGAGLAWNTNTLATDGTLRVVSLTPPTLTAQFSNNLLDISWPVGNTGWRLQSQSNPLSVGISNNWANVANTLTTNHVTIAPNPTNGTVFYRLIYVQ